MNFINEYSEFKKSLSEKVNEARDADLIKQLTDTFDKFKLNRKYEIMMDSLFGGGSKIAVLRKRNTYGGGAMIDTLHKDGGSNYEGYIEILSSRSGRPIPGKSKFDNIDDAMKAATKFVDSIKESVNEYGPMTGSGNRNYSTNDLVDRIGDLDDILMSDRKAEREWEEMSQNYLDGQRGSEYWGDLGDQELQDAIDDAESLMKKYRIKESVTEAMDLNDPVLVAFRRTRAIMELPKFKSAEVKSRRISFNKYMDLLDSQTDINVDIANYVDIMAQTLRDMEQEAEPEGGAIADKYGSIMMKQEKEYAQLKAKKAKIDARIEKYKMS